jgi:hypothetical protein
MHLPPNTLPIGVRGINNNNNVDFLQGKGIKRMSKCLDGIFWDYKNHFAAYNLDHIIQVDARNDKTINTTLIKLRVFFWYISNHIAHIFFRRPAYAFTTKYFTHWRAF